VGILPLPFLEILTEADFNSFLKKLFPVILLGIPDSFIK
jgi:hypothetical protein